MTVGGEASGKVWSGRSILDKSYWNGVKGSTIWGKFDRSNL